MANNTFPEFTRHHPDGTITNEWMIGHLDPEHAEHVVITRPGRSHHRRRQRRLPLPAATAECRV